MDQAAMTVQFAVKGRFTAAIRAIDRRLVAIKVPSHHEWMFSITVSVSLQSMCRCFVMSAQQRLNVTSSRPSSDQPFPLCCLLLQAPSEHPHTSGWVVLHPEDLVLVPTAAVCQLGAQEVSDSVLLVSFSWLRSSHSDQPNINHHQPVFRLSSRIPQSARNQTPFKKKDQKCRPQGSETPLRLVLLLWTSVLQWTQLTTAFFCGDSRMISALKSLNLLYITLVGFFSINYQSIECFAMEQLGTNTF